MKVIDAHAHIFPQKIAERAVSSIGSFYGIPMDDDGTADVLLREMRTANVSQSLVCSVATKPEQVTSINTFLAEEAKRHPEFVPFAAMHPLMEDPEAEFERILKAGFYGIKLHPDYQDMYFDNIRYERIIDAASELGLITVVHAGVDPKCPEDVHCTPKMARKVLDDVKPEKLVLAHMGGNEMWDDVERYLVGQNVYFDTGVILNTMPQEQFLRIVHMHGADRILFGTDSPWADQKNFVALLEHMPLTEEEKAAIFSENAKKLLGI